MCIADLNKDNVARMTGNPSAQEAWLRTQVLKLVADYPILLQEALRLGQDVTFTITEGEDAGTYITRHGLRAPIKRKLERLLKLAIEMKETIEDLPKSSDAWFHAKAAHEGMKKGRRNAEL